MYKIEKHDRNTDEIREFTDAKKFIVSSFCGKKYDYYNYTVPARILI